MATRRIRRYRRKYQVDPTTLRAKVLLPQIYPRLEVALEDLASLEADCYAVLESLGVPEELWGYYEAFYYRAAELGLSYWDVTFQAELQLLIDEFVARGLSEDVLKALVDKLIPWLRAKRGIAKTVVFQSGFETGNYSEWSRTGGLGTVLFIDSVVKYEGNYSSRTEGDSFYAGYAQKDITLEAGKTYNLYGYFRCDSFDFSRMGPPWDDYVDYILGFQDSIGDPAAATNALLFALQGVSLNILALRLCYRRAGAEQMVDTGLLLETGKWYKVRLEVYVDAANGYVKLYIDDVLTASKTSCNTSGILRITAGSGTTMWMTRLAKRQEWVDSIKVDEP
jgi:hypothetical protein